jgi:DNA-directed RNA polymerase subunit E'/Rpb7
MDKKQEEKKSDSNQSDLKQNDLNKNDLNKNGGGGGGKGDKSDKDDKNLQNSNKELYKTIVKEDYIYLKPTDLNFKIDNIILSKLKKKIEGKCIKEGYIIPDSVIIQTRTLGMINNASFDGMTTYKVTFTCNICNPVNGQMIRCKVGNIDKSQVICYIDEEDVSPIEIYLFKQHHVGNEEYASLKIGDIVSVKIGGSKWEFESTQIISIAQLITVV